MKRNVNEKATHYKEGDVTVCENYPTELKISIFFTWVV